MPAADLAGHRMTRHGGSRSANRRHDDTGPADEVPARAASRRNSGAPRMHTHLHEQDNHPMAPFTSSFVVRPLQFAA